MGVFCCNTNVDGIPVVKLMVFIEGSQVENSMKKVVVSIFTEHAEVDLWNHYSEWMKAIKTFSREIPKAFSTKLLEVCESDDQHCASIKQEQL